ncbi:MAG: hypothetical protein PHG19_11715 [Anaerotignum sp.]|nr:hypothetical protein [Anaerotignum sp.]
MTFSEAAVRSGQLLQTVENLGRRPLTAQDRADGEAGFCKAKVMIPCLLFVKSKTNNFYYNCLFMWFQMGTGEILVGV